MAYKINYKDVFFFTARPECKNLNPPIDFGDRDHQAYFACDVHYRGSMIPEIIWKHSEQTLNSHLTEHNSSYISASLFFEAETQYNGYKFQCQVGYPSTRMLAVCHTNPLQILCKYMLIKNVLLSNPFGKKLFHV